MSGKGRAKGSLARVGAGRGSVTSNKNKTNGDERSNSSSSSGGKQCWADEEETEKVPPPGVVDLKHLATPEDMGGLVNVLGPSPHSSPAKPPTPSLATLVDAAAQVNGESSSTSSGLPGPGLGTSLDNSSKSGAVPVVREDAFRTNPPSSSFQMDEHGHVTNLPPTSKNSSRQNPVSSSSSSNTFVPRKYLADNGEKIADNGEKIGAFFANAPIEVDDLDEDEEFVDKKAQKIQAEKRLGSALAKCGGIYKKTKMTVEENAEQAHKAIGKWKEETVVDHDDEEALVFTAVSGILEKNLSKYRQWGRAIEDQSNNLTQKARKDFDVARKTTRTLEQTMQRLEPAVDARMRALIERPVRKAEIDLTREVTNLSGENEEAFMARADLRRFFPD